MLRGHVVDEKGRAVLGVVVSTVGQGWRSAVRANRKGDNSRPQVNGVELRGLRAEGTIRHRFVTGDRGEFVLGPFAEGEVDLSFFHDRFQPKFVRGIGVVKGEEEQLQDVTLIPGTSLVVSFGEDCPMRPGP